VASSIVHDSEAVMWVNSDNNGGLCMYVQKELGDRKSSSIDFVRQLLPLPKMFCEVIMSEYVHGGTGDSRSGGSTHKTNSDSDQRKQVGLPFGLKISSNWMNLHQTTQICINKKKKKRKQKI